MFSRSNIMRLISGVLFIGAGIVMLYAGRETIHLVLAGLFALAGFFNIALIFVFKRLFPDFQDKK